MYNCSQLNQHADARIDKIGNTKSSVVFVQQPEEKINVDKIIDKKERLKCKRIWKEIAEIITK